MYLKQFFSPKFQFHFQRNESGKTRAKGEPTYGHIQQENWEIFDENRFS